MIENSVLRKYYKIHIVQRGDKIYILKNYITDHKNVNILYVDYIFRSHA